MWPSFKRECYYRHTDATKAELIAAVDNWMIFYTNDRKRAVLGMRS
ncbi:transposase [Mycobacterium haemophilum DSM 44634]